MTYGKGRRGQRWQGDEERGTGRGEIRYVRELSPEGGREGDVWVEEMAPPLQSCAQCVLLIGCGSSRSCIMEIDFSEYFFKNTNRFMWN